MVHEEILRQLGGNKFLVMTGSKNLLYSQKDNNFLSMHLTRNKLRAKYLKIVLEPNDTYTIIFSTTKKDEHVVLKRIEGVYNDMLQDVFTEETGLYTSL